MTPLFAASLASQPGQTQTDGGTTASVAPGALRATQKSVDFTPTQGRAHSRSGNERFTISCLCVSKERQLGKH